MPSPPKCLPPLMTLPLPHVQNGWSDSSQGSQLNWQAGNFGADGGGVVCADLGPGGTLAGGLTAGCIGLGRAGWCSIYWLPST